MKRAIKSLLEKRATAALIAIVALFAFSTGAFAEARLDGVAFYKTEREDSLQMKVSEWRTPVISRYGNLRRIVLEFEDTAAGESMKRLLSDKRGNCVEKFEVQMFRYSAAINTSGGIRKKLNSPTTLLVAYVEAGVDVKLSIIGDSITATYFRIENSVSQTRPAPVNEIEDVLFAQDEDAEYLLVKTTDMSLPELRDVEDPRRLLVTYLESYTNPRVKNQVVRVMENATLFKMELLGLGTMPSPYKEYDDSGEYHFVGIPTPMAYNSYQERGYGQQYNSVAIVLSPKKNVEYHVLKRIGSVLEIAFVKKVDLKEKKPVYIDEDKDRVKVYDIEDEHRRPISFDE